MIIEPAQIAHLDRYYATSYEASDVSLLARLVQAIHDTNVTIRRSLVIIEQTRKLLESHELLKRT
jgi:hypothetical protein